MARSALDSSGLQEFVDGYIRQQVEAAGTQTPYRPPLIGYASADDPAWPALRAVADPNHALPADLLPGAASVVAFFIPFAAPVVRANRGGRTPSPEWTIAYRETNALINRIVQDLTHVLHDEWGVRAAGAPATANFDHTTLSCLWSHKSAACIAGLGSFGLHHLLITPAGCAGRCGSLVLDAALPPTPRLAQDVCRHFLDGKCTYCIEACPASALRAARQAAPNLDKQACWAHLQAVSPDHCCGKCATGPCALAPFA